MLSQHTNSQFKKETLFEVVYRLAKEKDEKALAKIVKEGSCLDAFQGEYNPIMLLAEEGDSESVELLINKFNA